ncbi:Protein OS-9 [Batrachochytrium dendrobatidis]
MHLFILSSYKTMVFLKLLPTVTLSFIALLTNTVLAETVKTGHKSTHAQSHQHRYNQQSHAALRHQVFSDMFKTPLINVVFGTQSISHSEASKLLSNSDSNVMQLKYDQSMFICSIPSNLVVTSASASVVDNTEKNRIILQAMAKLKTMGSACLKHSDRLWDYDFCPGKYVRQHHTWPKTSKQKKGGSIEYFLGYMDKEKLTKSKSKVFSAPQLIEDDDNGKHHLRQVWGFGDMCTDIGEHRTVEVQYHCCTHQHISYLREYSVCKYIVSVHTPIMCFHPIFESQKQEAANQIQCKQIEMQPLFPETMSESSYIDAEPKVISAPVTPNVQPKKKFKKWLTAYDMNELGCTSPIQCIKSLQHPIESLDGMDTKKLQSQTDTTSETSADSIESDSTQSNQVPSDHEESNTDEPVMVRITTIEQEWVVFDALLEVRYQLAVERQELAILRLDSLDTKPIIIAGLETALSTNEIHKLYDLVMTMLDSDTRDRN